MKYVKALAILIVMLLVGVLAFTPTFIVLAMADSNWATLTMCVFPGVPLLAYCVYLIGESL